MSSSSPVSLLGAALLEQGIDTLLRLDPITRQRLALIDGRVIRVIARSPSLDVTAIVTEGRVSISTGGDDGDVDEGDVDLTVTGSLAGLRSLAGSQDALHSGDVTITGDLRVASHLREILAGIDPDWQELVSPMIGDTATHKLERAARDALAWLGRTRESLAEDTHDYLVDEVSLVANSYDLARFSDAVDDIREDADRLAARVTRLERQSGSRNVTDG